MSNKTDAVAKARIAIVRNGERFALLSRKNAPGKPKHDKLEMLGGHLDAAESPVEALLRELREEERTGELALVAEADELAFETRMVDRAAHHLFELTITVQQYTSLEADPDESLGFELVAEKDLASGRIEPELTPRTRQILRAFGAIANRRSASYFRGD
jgi:ADP-ribose pyrophosphatase YjhB (NUDIX family)